MTSTGEKEVGESPPKHMGLFRCLVDQARIDDDVLAHQYDGSGTAEDPHVVTWIPGDAGNPMNWRKRSKWVICVIVAIECFATAFTSSVFSGCIFELIEELRVSTELVTAGLSLFVLGFAVGPLIWAPLSEIYGRQIVFVISFGAFTAFNAGCAGANNISTLLVLRFFAGSFGSSPLTNAGGVIADVFTASERGFAMALFSLAPSGGPTLGPMIGGFLGENEGWRWVMGLTAILAGVLWLAGTFLVPETYAPYLLRKRAAALSKRTGKVYKTRTDIDRGPISIKTVIQTALVRPWILLFVEPIVFLLSLYLAIIYGTLYLLFGAYPIVFEEVRGWSEGVGGLAFLGVAVGMIIGIYVSGFTNKHYNKAAVKNGGMAPPEARLLGSMIGAVAIPIGLFWFAWTCGRSVHWISPVMAGAPFGFGLILVFLSVMNYLIDAYTIFAASALAANSVLRSLFGAAFPLFTTQMYTNLGIHWASSVPAFMALAMLPVPWLLYKYGAPIRARCPYAAQAEAALKALRAKAATGIIKPVSEPARTESADTSDTTTDAEPEGRPQTATDVEKTASTPGLHKTASRAETVREPAEYDENPYDIDRVNTLDSIAGVDLRAVRSRKQ